MNLMPVAICTTAASMVALASVTTIDLHRPVAKAEPVVKTDPLVVADTIIPKTIRVIPIVKQDRLSFADRLSADKVGGQTAPVQEAAAEPVASVSAAAPPALTPLSDVCSRHHLRKVVTHSGRSWRCR